MASPQDLFLLISSLTRYEKAYCMKHFRQLSGKKNTIYLELFQAVYKQEEYDESTLRKRFAQGAHASQFSVAKRYLYVQVTQALSRYYAKHSRWATAFEDIRSIEILIARKMYPQAERELVRLQKSIQKAENPVVQLLVSDLMRFLREQNRADFAQLDALLDELGREQNALAQLQERNVAWEQFCRVEHLSVVAGMRQGPELAQELAALLGAQGFAENRFQDTDARYFQLATQIRYFLHADENDEAMGLAAENMVRHIESTPDFGGLAWQRYYGAVLLYTSVQSRGRNYVKSLRGLVRVYHNEDLFPAVPSTTMRFMRRLFLGQEMRIYAGLGRFDIGVRRLESLPVPLRECRQVFNPLQGLMTFTNIAWIYLGAGRLQEAKSWAQAARNLAAPSRDFDYFNKLLLIELVIVFELEDDDLLDSRLTAFRRLVKRRDATNLYDKLVFSFFHSALHAEKAQLPDLFREFHAGMLELQAHPDQLAKRSMEYFYMEFWAESKVLGQSFAEVTQRHRAQPEEALFAEALAVGAREF